MLQWREKGERRDRERRRCGRDQSGDEACTQADARQPSQLLTSRALETVPGAAHRKDQPRVVGLLLELLAQETYVHVDATRVPVGAVASDRAKQFLAVEETSRRGRSASNFATWS